MTKAIDIEALGRRLIELLRCGPEATIELAVLRSGQVLASKINEEAQP